MSEVLTYTTATVGDRIKAARRVAGLTQKGLADALERSRAAIGQWEINKTSPAIDTIVEAARILRVSAEWLAFGRADPEFQGAATDATTIIMHPSSKIRPRQR